MHMVIPSAIPKNIVIKWDKIANDLKDLFIFLFFMVKPFLRKLNFINDYLYILL